ncbi:hypothetical protein X736_13230 [Mesorhizobium sp. L2C089B000]|nr:hypothetical protein X736_13230 [Mesorhizobium sp. L2C089B000]
MAYKLVAAATLGGPIVLALWALFTELKGSRP